MLPLKRLDRASENEGSHSPLKSLGWNSFFEGQWSQMGLDGLFCGRVIREDRGQYLISTGTEQFIGKIRGGLRYESNSQNEGFPHVGDWVAFSNKGGYSEVLIEKILPRQNQLIRKAVGGESTLQVFGSNIDLVFLVLGLEDDFNLRRVERFTFQIRACEIAPVLILSKSDLVENGEEKFELVRQSFPSLPVHKVSAHSGEGMEQFKPYLIPGNTLFFVGSSGVGKSTLINFLLGEDKQKVNFIRQKDGRGQHTTTRRELIPLQGGAWLVDSPGVREIQLRGDEEKLGEVFQEIEKRIGNCRFSNCSHVSEPGCSILEGIESGILEEDEFQNYQKMLREIRFQEKREKVRLKKGRPHFQAKLKKSQTGKWEGE